MIGINFPFPKGYYLSTEKLPDASKFITLRLSLFKMENLHFIKVSREAVYFYFLKGCVGKNE